MSPEFDLLAARIVARGRLLETALHAAGPWWIVLYGAETECRAPAQRVVLDDLREVALIAHVSGQCDSISAVDIYCAGDLVTVQPVAGAPSAPCRISLRIGASETEPAW